MNLAITLTIFQLINILLVLVLLFLGFKVFENKWSYKISKPHNWDEAVKNKTVSKKLIKLERTYHDKVRFYTIWLQIERLKKANIKGAFAELGVYQGETAKFIHEMDNTRQFHLFDTFEGFSETDLTKESSKDEKYNTSNFSDTSLAEVENNIGGNEKISFYTGYFPDSAKGISETNYAFVHLDADLYLPTIAALKYFYPKLSNGGAIIIHDYNHTWDGIKQAVEEFIPTVPESIIEIADWQGSAMIIKNS